MSARNMARWDADLDAYALTPIHDDGALMTHAVEDAAKAIAWGYTIEGGPDTAPERLRERREALGLSVVEAAAAVTALGFGEWDETSIHYCESPRALLTVLQRDLAAYAAALSTEEARRAAKAKPETWHARLVRLAQAAQATGKACADAEAAFRAADAERERSRLARAAAREACDVARKALTAATTAAAIVTAAQAERLDWLAEPTRPEPRFKVGDWARDRDGVVFRITEVVWGSAGVWLCGGCPGGAWAEDRLTPALDPVLHETARKTVAWLRGKGRMPDVPLDDLSGYDEWASTISHVEWAVQLERLLGDAP